MSGDVRALEAVRYVASEYGIPTRELKPCVALLLDGNLGMTDRHKAGFIVAIECRRIGWDEERTRKVLERWARKVGVNVRDAQRAVVSAFARRPDGSLRYHPPGLVKKPGGSYETLSPTCIDVGCPANCPPLMHLRQAGAKAETLKRWEQLGWPEYLRRKRWTAAADVYRAICLTEVERGFAPGKTLYVTYRQLALLAHRDHTGIGRALDILHSVGLLSVLVKGSGSGPHARDRKATQVARTVPIPAASPPPAYTTGGEPRPPIGDLSLRKKLGGKTQSNIGRRRGRR